MAYNTPATNLQGAERQKFVGMSNGGVGVLNLNAGSATATPISAGTVANTVVKSSSGTLVSVIVTTLGTNAMLIYDNATTNSGTIIGAVPASAAVGSIFTFAMPAINGITVAGNAANPAVTIGTI